MHDEEPKSPSLRAVVVLLAGAIILIAAFLLGTQLRAEAGGKHDWEYTVTCEGVSGTRPNTDSVDSNIRIKNLDTGEVRTFNYHGPDSAPAGPFHYTLAMYGVPSSWVRIEIQWVQVNGTNYHWEGHKKCDCTKPTESPSPTSTPTVTPSVTPSSSPTPTLPPSPSGTSTTTPPSSPSIPPSGVPTTSSPPSLPPTLPPSETPTMPPPPTQPPSPVPPAIRLDSYCLGDALVTKREKYVDGGWVTISTSTINGARRCAPPADAPPIKEEGF